MDHNAPFNLSEFMFSHFCRVDFGGNLFGQWPVGIRFEIGIEQISRAVKLFEFTFDKAKDCILVSQDWKLDARLAKRFTPLFKTPGIFTSEPSQFQTVEVSPFDESPYQLTWTRLFPRTFNAALIFQAIANGEQLGDPKISSKVYIIDPRSKTILHMYDDRGLDIIATELKTLRPVFEGFSDWILDNQHDRIKLRFKTNSPEMSE
jgi:hypothetical protein